MAMPALAPTTSYRKHPTLAAMFKAAENRHLTAQEFAEYVRVLPAESDRAKAAKEISDCEQAVVERVITEVFAVYPFVANHAFANAKCIRDVRSVSAYATLSMLMNDPHWFRDKLLLWLRTILQSLHFPDRESTAKKTLFGTAGAKSADTSNMPPNIRSIHETYNKLRSIYKERLTENSFALIEPYLTQAVDTLSGS
jgi:hypothetical protein